MCLAILLRPSFTLLPNNQVLNVISFKVFGGCLSSDENDSSVSDILNVRLSRILGDDVLKFAKISKKNEAQINFDIFGAKLKALKEWTS